MSFLQGRLFLGIIAIAMLASTSIVSAEFAATDYTAFEPAASANHTFDEEGCLDNDYEFSQGLGCWVYHDNGANDDKPVRVWYYYPVSYSSDSGKVVFAIHGSSRNAHEALERWQQYADTHGALVIAPEFSREHYAKGRNFTRGNVRDDDGEIRDERDWTFSTIEEIFDLVQQEIAGATNKYSIQGHSAGGQFVHRMVLSLHSARIETAVSAGSGWYLLPDESDDYPCGISNIGTSDDDLKKSYATDLVITLGTYDVDTKSRGLSHRSCAEAQGSHRYERGHYFYAYTEEDASLRGHTYNWTVVDVPGAGHDADSVVETAAQAIFGEQSTPESIVLSPTQDATVKASYPNSNYGTRKELQVDGNSLKITYMQFDLRSVRSVRGAMLRLKITDPSNGVQHVKEVASNSWNEGTLTYSRRPAASTNLASINGGGSDSWVSIDLTDYVAAKKGQVMSIALDSLDSNGLYFKSKESSDDRPQLVIYD